MLFLTILYASICALAVARALQPIARSLNDSILLRRADVELANGTSMQYSTADNEPAGLEWQASGVLIKGGCSSTIQFITDCYELEMSDDPSLMLDPGYNPPRQRTEFLSNTKAADGTAWKYTWKSYYQSYDTGSDTFFHIMQIFSDTGGGPAVFLDILASGISLKDVTTDTIVATATLASFFETPLLHTLSVTYGPSGSFNYAITNSQTGASILQASQTGAVGSGENYIKFGLYRAVYTGMPSLKAWYGDYTAEQT